MSVAWMRVGLSQDAILETKLTILEKNQTVDWILQAIEKKTGYTIAYSGNIGNLQRRLSVNFVQQRLNKILKHILDPERYAFRVLGQKILIYNKLKKYTVSGYVTETASQEYLNQVMIYDTIQAVGTTTNVYGFYSITLPEGKHQLVFSLLGYAPKVVSLQLDRDESLHVDLGQQVQALDEILIKTNLERLKSTTTQMSTEEISPTDIQVTPVIAGEQDVLKTIQFFPGIQAANEASAGMLVRGGATDQNLIILDESTIYNSSHLFNLFSIFNGDAIKTVEVIKGGFPSRYGGRLSSVIKVNTKNGHKQKISGKINISMLASSILVEGPIQKHKSSFVLSGRRSYLDLLFRPFLGSDIDFGFNFSDLNAKIHHVFDDKNKLYWSFYFGEDKFKTFEEFKGEDINNRSSSLLKWGNAATTLRWNHEFSNRLFSNTSLIFSNYIFKTKSSDVTDFESSFRSYKSNIFDYGFKMDFDYFPDPAHTLRFGANATFHNFTPSASINNFKNSNTNSIFSKKNTIQSTESGVYLEDEWKFSDSFRFYPGFRLSHFVHKQKNYLRPEPRLALAYLIQPNWALKASFSMMNQYIHRISYTGSELPTDIWISSSNNIKPQRASQWVIGATKDFANRKYNATIEGYFKTINDMTMPKERSQISESLGNETLTLEVQDLNFEEALAVGKGWGYGMECIFRKKKGNFKGWLSYTLSWSKRQFDQINQGRIFFDRFDRRHLLSLVSSYTFDRPHKPNKKTTLSANWVFATGMNFNVPNRIGVNPESVFPIQEPQSDLFTFQSKRNNFRGENFHRLVLGIQFHKTTRRKRIRTWGWSIYNIYARKNPFFYQAPQRNLFAPSDENLKRWSLFRFFPSFHYSLKF